MFCNQNNKKVGVGVIHKPKVLQRKLYFDTNSAL